MKKFLSIKNLCALLFLLLLAFFLVFSLRPFGSMVLRGARMLSEGQGLDTQSA